MARAKIGLALGSGSARGWAHIGVIEALGEAGIAPDVIAGCSIGALVGAALAAGRLEQLKAFALSLSWREIARLTDVKLTAGGLVGGAEVVAMLERLGISAPIESLAVPYVAIATDLGSGREVWLRDGPVTEAVRASISLPGIFSPAQREGRWLVDGGLVNPVPVSACRALGADIVIAVNLNGDLVGRYGVPQEPRDTPAAPEFLNRLIEQMPMLLRRPAESVLPKLLDPAPNTPGYFEVLMGSINVMQDQITRARLAGDPPHVALTPRLEHITMLEFNRAPEAIAEGRACVAHALPFIKRYL
ncbi:MAG: patatin-like phospholipase family protein [Hyphomicrobiaceae bacterium]|nr:patatin-like phospholipase family protein [Hyphomicrobiaceae bacterium]